jgi:hypothetical protein
MNICALICLFLFSFSGVCAAQTMDIPQDVFGEYVKKVPTCFYHQGENVCEGFHWDTIGIQAKSEEIAYVSIELETINAHGCGFRGIGRWDGERLHAIGRSKGNVAKPGYLPERSPWGACKISVVVYGDVATYYVEEDTENYCHSAFCSARGWLGYPKGAKNEFRRKE